jgi:ATP-dependent DNA helicase RecG
MQDSELERLLYDLESDRVERKASTTETDKIRQAICAFANDLPGHGRPGVVFIGARDDGSCADLRITDELLRNLADMRSDGNITPFPTMTVQKRSLKGGEYAVVAVHPSDAPPVRYKGRTWIRVGPRRAIATPEEERRLCEKRRSKDLPFDLRVVDSATLNDLDLTLFYRVYLPASVAEDIRDQNERTELQQLCSLRFVTAEPDPKPTVVGVLTIGKDPRQFIPGAYVQFLRIDGTTLTEPIKDQKEIDGPLPELLRQLDEVFLAHISVGSEISGRMVEVRRPEYPIEALRQLARNAILHRTYEGTNSPGRVTWFTDRIEIISPGGPYGQVNCENFGRPGITDYRNPYIAEAMKNLGYVQRFGIGIELARKELASNGNPEPIFDVTDTHVLVTVGRRA